MRRLFPLLLCALTACASSKLIQQDVIAVAKAPAREWKSVAVTAGVVGATLLLDDELSRIAQRNDSSALDSIAKNVETFGGGGSDKVIAGFALYGVVAKNDRARAVAFDAIVSSVIASKAITPALKELTGRERPNGGDASFPSNHATQAFAVASVIAGHYPEKRWVRWVAYGIANGVALSRVYHDAHYTTDVLAGAAIGALVGRTVVTTNRRERATWTVTPARNGVVVSARW
jgi:hypothetical protein